MLFPLADGVTGPYTPYRRVDAMCLKATDLSLAFAAPHGNWEDP